MKYEQRMHRWIQVKKEDSIALEMKQKIPIGSGYHYVDSEGNEMVEHHVDSCDEFQQKMNEEEIF